MRLLLVEDDDLMKRQPLHYASGFCRSQTVFYLLKYGADPSAQDKEGNTPLHIALLLNHIPVIGHLTFNTRVDIKNNSKLTCKQLLKNSSESQIKLLYKELKMQKFEFKPKIDLPDKKKSDLEKKKIEKSNTSFVTNTMLANAKNKKK